MSAAAYREQFSFERVIVRAFDIIRANLMLLTTLTLVLYGLPRIGAAFLEIATSHLPGFPGGIIGATSGFYRLCAGLGAFALQAAVMYVAAAELNGREPSIIEALRTGLRYLLPILGIFVVTLVAVIAGCILLIVPGLFVATIWSVATPAAVVERLDVGSALRRSASLTQGYRWQVFAFLALFVIAAAIIGGMLNGVQHGFLHPFSHGLDDNAEALTDAVLDTVAALIGSVGVMSIYFELRRIKEEAGPEDLAAVLEP